MLRIRASTVTENEQKQSFVEMTHLLKWMDNIQLCYDLFIINTLVLSLKAQQFAYGAGG